MSCCQKFVLSDGKRHADSCGQRRAFTVSGQVLVEASSYEEAAEIARKHLRTAAVLVHGDEGTLMFTTPPEPQGRDCRTGHIWENKVGFSVCVRCGEAR